MTISEIYALASLMGLHLSESSFHERAYRAPCQKFGNTDYFFKLPIKATMRGSMKLWEAAQ